MNDQQSSATAKNLGEGQARRNETSAPQQPGESSAHFQQREAAYLWQKKQQEGKQ